MQEFHIIMSLCDSDLEKLLESKRMTDDEIKDLAQQMADASKFLDQSKIIHRDIKPGNILIKDDEGSRVFKLGDFGSVSTSL